MKEEKNGPAMQELIFDKQTLLAVCRESLVCRFGEPFWLPLLFDFCLWHKSKRRPDRDSNTGQKLRKLSGYPSYPIRAYEVSQDRFIHLRFLGLRLPFINLIITHLYLFGKLYKKLALTVYCGRDG